MDTSREAKKKKKTKIELQPKTLSFEDKRELANREETELEKQIQDLKTWTEEIESMNDEELKEYLKDRPPELKTLKISSTKPKVQRARKSRASKYTGIMASVMKFHKPDEEKEGSASANSKKF